MANELKYQIVPVIPDSAMSEAGWDLSARTNEAFESCIPRMMYREMIRTIPADTPKLEDLVELIEHYMKLVKEQPPMKQYPLDKWKLENPGKDHTVSYRCGSVYIGANMGYCLVPSDHGIDAASILAKLKGVDGESKTTS